MPGLIVLDGCATLQLSKGKNTLIDAENYPRLSRLTWQALASPSRPEFYAVHDKRIDGKTRRTRLSHVILSSVREIPRSDIIDHRNRDTLDNRRENLRPATVSQNRCNSKKHTPKDGASSPYKGVKLMKDGTWMAAVTKDGKRRYLGCFDSEVEAAAAYDKAANELHGEFARTNGVEWSGETTRRQQSSVYRGVSWDKRRSKWKASIKDDGRTINVGRFDDETAAARAYNRAALELRGESARLNEDV